MLIALPLLCLAVGGILGYWLGKAGQWLLFLLLMLAGIAVFAFILFSLREQETTGFDGVAEVALSFLALVPLEFGALVGAGVALIRNKRSQDDT